MDMTETELQRTVADMVSQEVHYCVSSLVHTLAQGYGCIESTTGNARGNDSALVDLIEQAAELSSPVPDYKSAAEDEGIEVKEEEGAWLFSTEESRELMGMWSELDAATDEAEAWQEACGRSSIEPHDREVFEHWIVSDWLADKLEAHGEKIDRDFAGLIVWGRTTTGQAISMDELIRDIYRDTQKRA